MQVDSVSYYPRAGSPKFAPDSVVWHPSPPDSVWAGIIVHPGRVVVTGTQGGTAYTDTIPISVTDRSSFAAPQVVLDTSAYNTYPLPEPQSGNDTLHAGRLHVVPANAPPDSSYFSALTPLTDSVTSGPNKGYYWVTQSSIQMLRAYSLNEWIDPPGSTHYTNNQGWLSTTEYLISIGDSVEMMAFRAHTIEHERGPSSGQNSHLERLDAGAASPVSCGNLNEEFERLVSSYPFDFGAKIQSAWIRALEATNYLAGHLFVHHHHQLPEAIAFYGTPRPNVVNDSTLIDTPYDDKMLPDSIYCDISGI